VVVVVIEHCADASPNLTRGNRSLSSMIPFLSLSTRRCLLRVACLFLLSAPALTSMAHPHVWIDYSASAQMAGQKLVAVRETWTFSKGFPISMVGDFSGMTKSGPVDPTHTAMFKVQAFEMLKGSDYFTHIFIDGKPASLGEARDFSVSVEDGHIVYRFMVPLATQPDVKRTAVTLGIYDDSFFVDFSSNAKLPVTLSTAAPAKCRAVPFEDHDHAIFGGSIFPEASRITC
jgi:ABC-type uncharacterized transport system substrate-binding protein